MAVLPVGIKGTLQGTAPIKRKMYSMRLALVAVLLLFQQGTFGLLHLHLSLSILPSGPDPKRKSATSERCSAAP